MTQFFNRQEAENFASNVKKQFPQLRVDGIHNISNKETGEYQYSYFSIWFGDEHLFHTYVSCQKDWNIFLSTCEYVVQAIADNQQSEEVDNRTISEQWNEDRVDWNTIPTLPMTQKIWSEATALLNTDD